MEKRPGLFTRAATYFGFKEPKELRSEPAIEPPYGSSVVPPARTEPLAVTTEKAMGISAVYRAVSLIAGHVSQLPVTLNRDGAEIPATPFIRQPDPNISRASFLEQTTVALALTGNAYWRVFRKDDSDPVSQVLSVEVLNPHNVHIDIENGRKVFKYSENGVPKTFKEHQVQHLKLLNVPGSHYGLGPIQAAQVELRGALDTRDYSTNWFTRGGVPNGVLSTDQALNPDQADLMRQRWMELQESYGRGVAVLGNGLSYQPIYLNPKDAQFIENQAFNVQQVARLFGIPANKMNAAAEGSNLTYQNIESASIDYVRDTLMSYLVEIEQALTALTRRGQEAKFKVEALQRADLKTRIETYKLAIEAGIMTVTEVRKEIGLPPLTKEAQPGETPGGTTEPDGV